MRIFSLIFVLCPILAIAQLHVAPNAFLYANDRLLYVDQGVSLANNSNIYLRNESQLIQGSLSPSANSGLGRLSVYQEGTVDNFEYNYWCSPVGDPSGPAGNSDFGISLLGRPSDVTTSDPAVILGNAAMDGISSPLSIAPRWIYKFLSGTGYSSWIQVLGATNISAGQGFTMKGTSGTDATTIYGRQNNPGAAQRYDFRGKPNDGEITINVATNLFTLTGNPYPSAIDLSAFLNGATNSTGIAYFWEQDKTINSHLMLVAQGGYGTFSPGGGGMGIYVPAAFMSYNIDGSELATVGTGGNYPRRFAPIGQGFMIQGNGNGPSVTMSNLFRVYQKEDPVLSVFERSGTTDMAAASFLPPIMSVSGYDYTTVSTLPVPQIRLNALLNGQVIRQSVAAFSPLATVGVDHAMDARSPDMSLPADVYFVIDGNRYVISVTDFDVDSRIPLGFDSVNGANFKVVVSELLNFDTPQVFIHDKMTGIYHDVKNSIFDLTLAAGTIEDRFELTFKNTTLSVADNETSGLMIVQNNTGQQLIIKNPTMDVISDISIVDMAGKRILDSTSVQTELQYSFDTSAFSEGVYIVRVKGSERDWVQKIIVNRNN